MKCLLNLETCRVCKGYAEMQPHWEKNLLSHIHLSAKKSLVFIAAPAISIECLRSRKKLTRKIIQKIVEDRKDPRQLASRLFKPLGGPISRPQLSLIGNRSGFVQALLALVPTPLVLRDNRLVRLKPPRRCT
ncbi:hypothetical protein TNCV_2604691 [Trichonephila clavipes]|nr:hypothetical protein TNCV_2604691 [Trichonephila clavipes]